MNLHGERPPSWYDPPAEAKSWPCGPCAEQGYMGCVDEVCFHDPSASIVRRVRTDFCLKHHECEFCRGEGRVYASGKKEYDE